MAIRIQKELLSLAGAKREIELRVKSNPPTNQFVKIACDNLNRWEKKLLNETYRKVKHIDYLHQNNWIDNIDGANRMREIYRSMTIGRMVRNKIADIDILNEEIITLKEVEREYLMRYHSTQLIIEAIQDHEFIQKSIIDLAKDGKPFKSKNHDEIIKIEKELDELEISLLMEDNRVNKLFDSARENSLQKRLQELKDDDFFNSKFPIEDICFKIVAEVKSVSMSGDSIVSFNGQSFERSIWMLSKTAQEKLINQIVRSYTSMYKNEIAEYRANKNKIHKKDYMKKKNTKWLSAEDKRKLVQLYKADGLSQRKVADQIGCSYKTVQNYWNTTS